MSMIIFSFANDCLRIIFFFISLFTFLASSSLFPHVLFLLFFFFLVSSTSVCLFYSFIWNSSMNFSYSLSSWLTQSSDSCFTSISFSLVRTIIFWYFFFKDRWPVMANGFLPGVLENMVFNDVIIAIHTKPNQIVDWMTPWHSHIDNRISGFFRVIFFPRIGA